VSRVRGRLLRNASWNLVDQALSALSNIALSVAVARSVDAPAFGAFSIAFVVFGVFIALTKSLVGQPLQMRFSHVGPEEQRRAAGSGLGVALVLGLVGSLVLVGVAFVTGPTLRSALLALALILPALLVQDSCRMALFTCGRARGAAGVDAVWALVMVGLLLVVMDRGSIVWLMLAWGAGALVSVVVACALLRVLPAPNRTVRWVRAHGNLTRYLFPEYFLGLGSMQLAILLVGTIAAAEAVGALRGAQVLLGPLGILGAGIFQFAVPEVARRPDLPTRSLALFAGAVSGFLGVVTIGYLAVLLLLPDQWGTALFGDSWPGAAAVLLAMGLSSVFSSLANGPAGVLYGTQQARSTFRIHAVKGPVLLAAVLLGTATGGAVGAAWALAATEAAVLPAWVLTLRAALRARSATPTAVRSEPERDDDDDAAAPPLHRPVKRATS
jgi:O-antigen/teichoic acid export membrane protein